MTANDIYTIAGSSSGTRRVISGDGGAATSALLDCPIGVAFDSTGDLYIADSPTTGSKRWQPPPAPQWGQSMTANDIYTVAGSSSGTSGDSGDGGAATSASSIRSAGIAIDSAGDLYIADDPTAGSKRSPRRRGTQWGQSMTADDIYTVAGSSSGPRGTPVTAGRPPRPAVRIRPASPSTAPGTSTSPTTRTTGSKRSPRHWHPVGPVDDGRRHLHGGRELGGTSGASGDGGAATSAKLYAPRH